MKLILFDIDGTLLWTDGAGRSAMEQALQAVFGTAGDPAYRYDGKTDRQIAREQMRAAGVSDAAIDERMDELLLTYVGHLGDSLGSDPVAARLCNGVHALLDAVEREREQLVMGLLTGNVQDGAGLKLRAVGLDMARFRVNAFGSDHEHRPELPRVAQRRAQDVLGLDLTGDRLVIIGDTPADIACGRPIGARTIGVATGRYGVDELASHAPHAVFADLSDTDRVLQVLLE